MLQISQIAEHLRAVYQVAKKRGDHHEQMAPLALAQELVNRVQANGEFEQAKTVLVIADLMILFAVVQKRAELGANWEITYLCGDDGHGERSIKAQVASKNFNAKPLVVKYSEVNHLEKKIGMQFDVIVGNPPYGELHLPILKKCVEHLTPNGISITIQPIRWLQDPLWKFKKTSDAKKYQSTLEGKIDSIEVISNEDATRIFEADMALDLGIITIKAAGGKLNYGEFSSRRNGIDFGTTGRILRETNFFQKFRNYDFKQQTFFPLVKIRADGSGRGLGATTTLRAQYGYFVNGLSVHSKYGDGLSPEQSFRANKRATRGKVTNWTAIEFDTELELSNFYNFLKLEAFRFYVFMTTIDVHVQDKFLPFPETKGAFLTPWTNERFFEHFGLTAIEQETIMTAMKTLDAR